MVVAGRRRSERRPHLSRPSSPPKLAPSTTSPPAHWPPTVPYLTIPTPSRGLPRALINKYCSPSPAPSPPPRLRILPISTPSHPACGQSGLFNAFKFLPRGTWLRDYLGVVHTELEVDPESDYDLCLERTAEEVIGIDASERGNEARFVNDYRGVAERPNAVFELRRWGEGEGEGEGVRMALWAGPKGIEKGAEVLVNYGRGFWEGREREEEVRNGTG